MMAAGGYWGDAEWYDLHLEERLPLAKQMLTEMVRRCSIGPQGTIVMR
jgi:hypothetical protein